RRPEGGGLDAPAEAAQRRHGAGDEREIGSQPGELVGVGQQGDEAVADEVHGRLVAGDDKQPGGRQHLGLVQTPFGFDGEGGEEVVGGGGPLGGDQGAQVAVRLVGRGPRLRVGGGGGGVGEDRL